MLEEIKNICICCCYIFHKFLIDNFIFVLEEKFIFIFACLRRFRKVFWLVLN